MNIRKAKSEDFDQMAELLKPMWLMHAEEEPEFIDKETLENFKVHEYLFGCLESNTNFFIVYEDNNEIIGCCRGEVKENSDDDFFVGKNILYLDDLVVSEKHRRKGLAKEMMDWFEMYAQENKIDLMKSRIYEFNKKPQDLFDKKNFKKLYSEYYKRVNL